MISTYFQYFSMIFSLIQSQKEIWRLVRMSIDINLLSISFNIFFFNPKPKRNLKVSKDVNWYQPTFNIFQRFFFNPKPKEIWRLVRMSIDINLLSISFNEFFFNPKPKRNLKVSKDVNWYQPTFNIFQWFFLSSKAKKKSDG